MASRFKDSHALIFIGDSLECAFRSKSDPVNKSSLLVGDFCQQWKIVDVSEVDQVFQGIILSARIETPTKQELGMHHDMINGQDRASVQPAGRQRSRIAMTA
jgi:hypothetical protein